MNGFIAKHLHHGLLKSRRNIGDLIIGTDFMGINMAFDRRLDAAELKSKAVLSRNGRGKTIRDASPSPESLSMMPPPGYPRFSILATLS